ncbi:hypothetical protein [Roseateles sp. P5_E11]
MNIEAIAYLCLGFGLPALMAAIVVAMALHGTRHLDATLRQVGVHK